MIKIQDIAYARFTAPDLDRMERFLVDFGLVITAREDDRIYARGTDAAPYLYVAERGEPGFLGFALDAASADDLRAAAQLDGASPVEKIDAPGGGQRVRLIDPDGFAIEVVHGRAELAPLPVESAAPLNRGSEQLRRGVLQRLKPGPAAVKRIGHAGIRVSDFRRSAEWYQSGFGFLASDEIFLGDESNRVAAFLRCDRGEIHTDHHTLVCLGPGEPGLDHIAFEVEDIDAVMVGHDHLKRAGYEHKVGVGRHVLGSQVFDYWLDPWGHVVEHFTDGDLLDHSHATGVHDPATALGTQWGTMTP